MTITTCNNDIMICNKIYLITITDISHTAQMKHRLLQCHIIIHIHWESVVVCDDISRISFLVIIHDVDITSSSCCMYRIISFNHFARF